MEQQHNKSKANSKINQYDESMRSELTQFIGNFIIKEFGANGRSEHRIGNNPETGNLMVYDADRDFVTDETKERLRADLFDFLNVK